jgi:hypothetical protein
LNHPISAQPAGSAWRLGGLPVANQDKHGIVKCSARVEPLTQSIAPMNQALAIAE